MTAGQEGPAGAPARLNLRSPFPYRCNRLADQARQHLADWVTGHGLIQGPAARARFERADFGWFAAVVYPDASECRLNLVADWFAWLFLVDDQLDDGSAGRDAATAASALRDLEAVMRGDRAHHGFPAAVALADLWHRTLPAASPGWERRFMEHLAECVRTAVRWEAANRLQGIVPDIATYIEKRRHTGAIYVCMDLIEVACGIALPGAVLASRNFTDALDAACNVVCWTNDVYSLEKERSLGEVHNLVFLVQHHHKLPDADALRTVCELINRETSRYLELEKAVLAAAGSRYPALHRYTAGMRSWMRGNHDWSSQTLRYHDVQRPEEYVEDLLRGQAPV